MLNSKPFARNVDGAIKHKEPCPNGDYPNEHVCLIGKENRFDEALRSARRHGGGTRPGFVPSDEHRQAISQAVADRHARNRAINAERDQEIAEAYFSGTISQKDLAARYNLGVGAIKGILNRYRQAA